MTDDQMAMGRRQLELEQDLIAGGMDPSEAATVAAEEVMGLPARRRARESLDAARAAAPPVSYGNAATLDNLDGITSELVVEDVLGGLSPRSAVPQSERVYRDDPTGGMAAQVAAREAAAQQSWERRGPEYAARTAEYESQYGPIGARDADVTPAQYQERGRRREAADVRRHSPYEEEARIRRMAERAGIPMAKAREMVQQGYDAAATDRGIPASASWQVSGVNRTAPPDFDHFSDAYSGLRDAGTDRRMADKQSRQEALQRRRMAQTNPLEYMNRDDVSDWNKMVAADSMLRRGYRGATPLDVDQATQQAIALQEQRRAIGEGFQPRTPEETQMLKDRAAADQRKNDPATAGMRDIQGGNFESEEARAVLLNVAKPYDTNWFGGAPESALPSVKKRLMDPPYNLPEARAEVAAREAMRQTNWW